MAPPARCAEWLHLIAPSALHPSLWCRTLTSSGVMRGAAATSDWPAALKFSTQRLYPSRACSTAQASNSCTSCCSNGGRAAAVPHGSAGALLAREWRARLNTQGRAVMNGGQAPSSDAGLPAHLRREVVVAQVVRQQAAVSGALVHTSWEGHACHSSEVVQDLLRQPAGRVCPSGGRAQRAQTSSSAGSWCREGSQLMCTFMRS